MLTFIHVKLACLILCCACFLLAAYHISFLIKTWMTACQAMVFLHLKRIMNRVTSGWIYSQSIWVIILPMLFALPVSSNSSPCHLEFSALSASRRSYLLRAPLQGALGTHHSPCISSGNGTYPAIWGTMDAAHSPRLVNSSMGQGSFGQDPRAWQGCSRNAEEVQLISVDRRIYAWSCTL